MIIFLNFLLGLVVGYFLKGSKDKKTHLSEDRYSDPNVDPCWDYEPTE